LYEETPVTRIENTDPMRVYTPQGNVRAQHVVVATNAFTPSLGVLRSSALRLQVQLFRSAPLSTAQRSAVAWPGREGIYTAHEMLESYRLTADQRIVGGAKNVRYGFHGAVLPDVDRSLADRLEMIFRQRFPELGDLAISDHWGGPIGMSLDFLPLLGRRRRRHNLLYAIAFAGHGIALASYAGEMIADLLLEREGPGRPLWSRPQVPLPPEPLRWLVFHALTSLFGGIDRRVDRSIE